MSVHVSSLSVRGYVRAFLFGALFLASLLPASLCRADITVSSLSLNVSRVVGGSSAVGTVVISSVAPTGGEVVTLSSTSSGSTNPATLPATATVPAGSQSVAFTITTSGVTSAVNVTISACVGTSAAQSATLTVNPEAVWSLTLNVTSVVGGSGAVGTVLITGTAPTGNVALTLASSDTTAATVPATVTVSAGNQSASFNIPTAAVTSVRSVAITASLDGITQTVTLTVNPEGIYSLGLNSNSVAGGQSPYGTVVLTGVAPAGGQLVTLSSSNSAVASVPVSITVPGGAQSGTFNVTTVAVTASTSVTITATVGSNSATTTLAVNPGLIGVNSVTLNPTSVVGGTPSTGTVTLATAAPTGGEIVALSSSGAAAIVPANVTVPAGATTAGFPVTTVSVTAQATPVITAAIWSSKPTATLTVTPSVITVSSVTFSPSTVVGGTVSTGTVTIAGAAPAGGQAVALSVSPSSAASVPAVVTVPAGATSTSFTASTPTVLAPTVATVNATIGASVVPGVLTVAPMTVVSVSLDPTSVAGGLASTGTVTLSGPAPNGGQSVTLSSDAPSAATVPLIITVPADEVTTSFTITTMPVTTATPAHITASIWGSAQSATLTVSPITVTGIALSPSSVVGGGGVIGTVTLSGPATGSGVTVALTSGNINVATVPSTVTVATGQTTATFTVTTVTVANSSTFNISGTCNSTTVQASLTVWPPVQLTGFSVSPASVVGGQAVYATVTLSGPAPTGGASVTLTSSDQRVIANTSLVVLAQLSTEAFQLSNSTTNFVAPTTLTAQYNGVTMTATLTLRPANLRVTTVTASGLALTWDAQSSSGFLLYRTQTPLTALPCTALSNFTPNPPSMPLIATVPSGQQTYTDTGALSPNTAYYYELHDGNGIFLSREVVTLGPCNNASDAGTADGRIDPRYATLHFQNFNFGKSAYRGGLYVGYADPGTDHSRVGRTVLRFPGFTCPLTGLTFRAGSVNCYLTSAVTTGNALVTVPVGCQVVPDTGWTNQTTYWSPQSPWPASFDPTAATNTQNATWDPTVTTNRRWLSFDGAEALAAAGLDGTPRCMVLASTAETTPAWVYFAKSTYRESQGPILVVGPNLMTAWDIPVPLVVQASPSTISNALSATCTATVNGVGLADNGNFTATMTPSLGCTVSVNGGAYSASPVSITFNSAYPFYLRGTGSGTVGVTVTNPNLPNISASTAVTVTN